MKKGNWRGTSILVRSMRKCIRCKCLQEAKTPASNLSREHKKVLNNLRNDPSIAVLPADKDNATVVIPTTIYGEKANDILYQMSTIGSATYWVAKQLAHILSPLMSKTDSYIDNSAHCATQ